MINLTPELRFKIDNIISSEAAYAVSEQKKYPSGFSVDANANNEINDAMVDSILNDPMPTHVSLLEKLSRDELIYVFALMSFGRGDGFENQSFEYVYRYCENDINQGTISYLSAKPLSRYLSQGLKNLGEL